MTKTQNKSVLYEKGVLIPNETYLGFWEGNTVEFIAGSSYYSFQTKDFIRGKHRVYVTVKNDVLKVETVESNND